MVNGSHSAGYRTRVNPYVGPRAFQQGEKLHGRRREIDDLVDRLIGRGITLLYAPSGAGKTSLIQAGLIPRLRKEADIEVLPVIRVGRIPQQSVAISANRYMLSTLFSLKYAPSPNQASPDANRVQTNDTALAETDLERYLQEHSSSNVDTLLIFDQFEEVLTLNPVDRDAKTDFFRALGEVLEKPRRWALFAIREEYLAALGSYKKWLPGSLTVSYRLEPLSEAAALEAIREPATMAGVPFTEEAAKSVVDYLRRVSVVELDNTIRTELGPYVEPLLLQVVCTDIWESVVAANVHTITSDQIPDERHFGSALQHFYLGAVKAAAEATGIKQQQILDWCAYKLITPLKTRSMVLQGRSSTDGIPNAVVDALELKRLVHLVLRDGVRWYELTHDRMIEAIQEANRPEQFRPTLEIFSKQKVDDWLAKAAYLLSIGRRTRAALNEPLEQRLSKMVSSPDERDMDAYSARLLFASQVLDGDIDLARQDLPELFAHLEGIWLSEVVRFKAYFIWDAKGGAWDPTDAEENYYKAWEQITHRLDSPVKASDLKALRKHIERYLTNGKVDTENNRRANELVSKKAYHLWELTRAPDFTNWRDAVSYVKSFYENVIDAATHPDPVARSTAAKKGLLLLQCGRGPFIATCLELATAIYFFGSEQ
jgi:hypothetical protein